VRWLPLIVLVLAACEPIRTPVAQPLNPLQAPSPLAMPQAREVARAPQVADDHAVYLPIVRNQAAESLDACGLNEQAQRMADLFLNDPGQMRPVMRCDPILAQVAQARAEDMARNDYFGHTDPDGHGPNWHVEQAGYRLPSFYDQSPTGNNIESIAGGFLDPDEAWAGLLNSPRHRTHLLGIDPFFREQTDYGFGYYRLYGSRYQYYFVYITARH
jgi:Cysteine-rich secretory protein family